MLNDLTDKPAKGMLSKRRSKIILLGITAK
jgi:hypothetical protein